MDTHLARGHFVRTALCAFIVLGLAAASAPAQAAPAKGNAPKAPGFDMRRSFGVNEADGVLWGGAADYKVRFGADEVEFTPALGRAAEHDLPFGFSTVSIARGQDVTPVAAATPHRVGAAAVEYDRAPGIVERHEVRADGLELSFGFAAKPAGSGDLVVRLELRSELPMALTDQGLRCVQAGLGGVMFGGVTGVDAQGHTVAGALHTEGGLLELRLPASFVDTAVYPLVLDPYIYPVVFLSPNPGLYEGNADAAYEWTGDRYLVVWEMLYSGTDIDVRGQLLDGNGVLDPFGYLFIEVDSITLAQSARVASLSAHSRFMVVWEEFPDAFTPSDIRGRSISTAGQGMSSIITIAGGPVYQYSPDIGGQSSAAADRLPVVWGEPIKVMHRSVFVPFSGDPTVAPSIQVLGPGGQPSISKSGGDLRLFFVAMTRLTAAGDDDIDGVLINDLGSTIWGPATIAGVVGQGEVEPDVDGDGTVFFTAFERGPEPTWPLAIASIHVARTVLGGSGFLTTETTIDDMVAFGLTSRTPSVAFTGNGALVAWSKQFGGFDYDIPLVGLDPWANTLADQLSYADYDTTYASFPAVCAKYSAKHSLGDGSLCAWGVTLGNPFDDGDIHAALVDPEFGIVVDLGGASVQGGTASVSAATVGNSGFTHFYHGLYGFNSVTLIVGVFDLLAPFCTGVLIPDPIYYIPLATAADATIVLPTPLPPDPTLLGLTIFEQYAESDPFTPPCGKKIQLSNGLSITIE